MKLIKKALYISTKRVITYKSNFIIGMTYHIGTFFITLYFASFLYESFFYLYYNKRHFYILLAVDMFIFKFLSSFILPGLLHLSTCIHHGRLDIILTYPISLRLYFLIINMDICGLLASIIPTSFFVYVVSCPTPINFSLVHFSSLILFIFFSLVLSYSYCTFSSALAFIFPSKGNAHSLLLNTRILRICPDIAIPTIFLIFYTYFVPVIHLSKTPTLVFLKGFTSSNIIIFTVSLAIWLLFSEIFWKTAKKHYRTTS